MHLEALRSNLMAAAIKGTQDDHFSPAKRESSPIAENTIQRKSRYTSKNTKLNRGPSPGAKEIPKVQEIAQLTLFDLP